MISNIRELQNCLIDKINHSDKVFIVGHKSPDFDAIGSAIGLSNIANYFDKDSYIIVDDDINLIEPGARRVIEDCRDKYKFITKKEFSKLVDDNSLLIITDTNKKSLISMGDELDKFFSILIIDHHSVGEDTIKNKDSYINVDVSSSSEIISIILKNLNISYDSNVASYLLAGISLDTQKFKRNTTSITHDIAGELLKHGANMEYINNLFIEKFDDYCRISNLIINGTTIRKYNNSLLQVSFTLDRNNPKNIYLKEDYAKAADRMIEFKDVDASFALGLIDSNTVHVSARSGKKVNVGLIMNKLNGGGNNQSAGGVFSTNKVLSIEKMLTGSVVYGINPEDQYTKR